MVLLLDLHLQFHHQPTTITGNDDNGATLAYDAGFIDVYLNGVKMVNGSDVTVTSGNSIVFASAIGTWNRYC